MPDKFGFDHLPDRGAIIVRCIEKDCGVGGPKYAWTEEMRREHYQTHYRPEVIEFLGETRIDICRSCGSTFSQAKKRGRPRVQCYGCKPEDK